MPLKITYSWHEGFPLAIAESPYEMVGACLGANFSQIEYASRLFHAIEGTMAGTTGRLECGGNAHQLTVAAGEVEIEDLWCDYLPHCRVPIADFRAALAGWIAFLSTRSAP